MSVDHVLHWPRACGKTSAIVRLAQENNGIIVTSTVVEARRLREQYNLADDQVMGWTQAESFLRDTYKFKHSRPRPIYVDNADYILSELIGGFHITAVALGAKPIEKPFE